MIAVDALSYALVAWAVTQLVVAIRACVPRKAHAVVPTGEPLRVLMLRPCAGADPWLSMTLGSTARTRHTVATVFALGEVNDTAGPFVRAALDALPSARVVYTGATGPNHKADQLARALAAQRDPFDVVVIADADVDLTDVPLDTMIDPFASDPALAAVWAPPYEMPPARTPGDGASQRVLAGSLQAFALLARLDPRGLVGKLVALRARSLERVGGFASLRHHLGEDMELARRLRAAGFTVRAATCIAPSRASGRSMEAVVTRFARWMQVMRRQRRALWFTYPLWFFGTFPVIVMGLAVAPWGWRRGGVAITLALLARVTVGVAARRAYGDRAGLGTVVRDAVASDRVLARAWLRSARENDVQWRATRAHFDRQGRLVERG